LQLHWDKGINIPLWLNLQQDKHLKITV
jgi:hypothetical protein